MLSLGGGRRRSGKGLGRLDGDFMAARDGHRRNGLRLGLRRGGGGARGVSGAGIAPFSFLDGGCGGRRFRFGL